MLDYASFKANIADMSKLTPISANPVALGQLGGIASGQVRSNSARVQALELQRQAAKDATAESTPVHIKAALMRAWCDITQVLRDIDGIGKPRPVTARNDPDAKPRKAKAQVIEPQ